MPKCIHAAPRRIKNPAGLPEAHRLWVERNEALAAYGAALVSYPRGAYLPPLDSAASTEAIRRTTASLLRVTEFHSRLSTAQAQQSVARPARSMWSSIFGWPAAKQPTTNAQEIR